MNKNKSRAAQLAASCAAALVLGGAWIGEASGAYLDCRMCHLDPVPGSTARDYFEYFASPRMQHPTGVAYPWTGNQDFIGATTLADGIFFFDTNGNGVADVDEVQLFGISATIECSSCHREHGDGPPPPDPNMYLRLANGAVCLVCHRT